MSEQAAEFDQTAFRQTMGNFATGVIITGLLDGEPIGFAAQSFVSLSLDPPWWLSSEVSSSWPKIRESGGFGINILGEDQQGVCNDMAQLGSINSTIGNPVRRVRQCRKRVGLCRMLHRGRT